MSKHVVGSIIQCVRREDGLTLGKRYYAADDDFSAIAVINDAGVQLWFPDDCFRDALEVADEKIAELKEEADWVRKKLNLPVETTLTTTRPSLAGELHVLCADAHGMRTYINAYKCDDKQGQIARLTVELGVAHERIQELEGRIGNALL